MMNEEPKADHHRLAEAKSILEFNAELLKLYEDQDAELRELISRQQSARRALMGKMK